MSDSMICPICKKELPTETDAAGVMRGFCDCIVGFRRPVIEVYPPELAPAAQAKEKKINDRPHRENT